MSCFRRMSSSFLLIFTQIRAVNNKRYKSKVVQNEKKMFKNQISIFPYWEIFRRKETSKTLWFNQDSIPEIDKSLSEKYLKIIMSNKRCLFLSINQESRNLNGVGTNQHTLEDLMKNRKYGLIHRSRDFLRQGYVEELFNFK